MDFKVFKTYKGLFLVCQINKHDSFASSAQHRIFNQSITYTITHSLLINFPLMI